MGIGDQLIATGLAKGAAARGKRIAFGGDGRIRWDLDSEPIFRDNPNIAPPGSERDRDLEWIRYYKGHRIYNRRQGNRWIWNPDWKAIPGEVFLADPERRRAARHGSGFVVIEPNVERKSVAWNKDWGVGKYQALADRLTKQHRVVQFVYPKAARLQGVQYVPTPTFRDALALLANADLYIGPEGGLHHGAAAMGTAAVVLFGGFIPPSVTGYDTHTNLTGGAEACGSLFACRHCRDAMARISVEEVLAAAETRLRA